ncbi:hypothetical protein AB9K35_19315 [Leisingera sp. XS_AS12]|uniref:hypothetical protein n=1 Tax=Leisingera sp. XS_AS12 TaxID=3241294 RepID=UPI0035168F2B
MEEICAQDSIFLSKSVGCSRVFWADLRGLKKICPVIYELFLVKAVGQRLESPFFLGFAAGIFHRRDSETPMK